MSYEQLLERVKTRRSIRRFKKDPIPDELILKILEVARWAPSGFNTQPWEFFVVKEAALRKKIVDATASFWKECKLMEKTRPDWQGRQWKLTGMNDEKADYTEAPVYILLCGDPRTQAGLPMGVQCNKHRRQLIYTSSLANAFLYMHLAAASLGLASQWYSAVQTPFASCIIKDLLKIPYHMEVYDMMVLGYPALTPPKKFLRPLQQMVHWGTCKAEEFRDDDTVKVFNCKTRNWTIGTHSRSATDGN